MYCSIGHDFMVQDSAVIGIFDLDNTTYSKNTRNFLEAQNTKGALVELSMALPKSFLLVRDSFGLPAVYISDIDSRSIVKRLQHRNRG